ncbi:MAG TPA: NUDIX domain-containing protein [Flavisolibacter sp.]|nr:NUDIX domain-containing protein [Flavisolibacter sp.]
MRIKIYFGDKPLLLISSLNTEIENYIQQPNVIFIDDFSSAGIKETINKMQQPATRGGVFLHNNIEDLLSAFKKELNLVQAAGGFIYSANNNLLLIFRRGKWDLPKGKLDEGEDLSQCAIREVREETGLINVVSEKFLCTTYHTYFHSGSHILKESHWFLMKGDPKQALIAQEDEGIEKCEWVPFNNLNTYLQNTHASIADVIDKGLKTIGVLSEI